MKDAHTLRKIIQEELKILNEQAAQPLSRIMSADRGPFADKMKGDPFEYEIVGKPCEEAEKVTFKVVGFTKKYPTGHPYRKRHQGKIGKRTLTKGKFRFPDNEKKYGKLAGEDSWDILRKKLGGPELICDRVKEAEKKEKKKPDADTGERTPPAGAEADPPAAQEETQDQASTTDQIGTLKYWVENGTTGLEDPEFKFDSDDPKTVLGAAVKKYLGEEGARRGYTKFTMGHALKALPDDQRGTQKYPEPSHALKAALVLMKNSDLYPRYYVNLDRIFGALRHEDSVKKKMGKDKLSERDMLEFAKFGSKELANYLGMPFFEKEEVSEALHITPRQFNQIILRELKSIGFIKEPQEENMKITKGQLRQIIREEIGRMDNDLDTNDDGMISVGELEAEIEDIKDDLEMESFEVLLFKRRGKKIETSRVYVDVNIAGHKDSRESKEAAKKVAEEEYPGWKAQFAEFDDIGGLDANL